MSTARTPGPSTPGPRAVARPPAVQRGIVRGGFPLAGLAVGLALGALLPAFASWSFLPAQDVREALGGLPPLLRLGVVGVLGLAAGTAVAVLGAREELSVSVQGGELLVSGDGQDLAVPRERVGLVCSDGPDLVVVGDDGTEYVRSRSDVPVTALRRALEPAGLRVAEDLPGTEDFVRWVDGSRGLSADEHARMRARATARSHEDAPATRQLRAELAGAGVAVRDRGGRQEWRRTTNAVGSASDR